MIWIPGEISPLASGARQRTAYATDASVSLIIQFAIWQAETSDILPNVIVFPVHDYMDHFFAFISFANLEHVPFASAVALSFPDSGDNCPACASAFL